MKGEKIMLKKTITYVDYNDEERTEDLYFNLTKAELMEMELGTTGGMGEMIKRIIDAKDTPAIAKIFKDIILKSYGVKSPDGKRFIKNDTLREEFEQSPAYSEMIVSLFTDTKAASDFMNAIVPADIRAEMVKNEATMLANK